MGHGDYVIYPPRDPRTQIIWTGFVRSVIRHPVCQFKAIFLPTCGGFVPFHLEIYVGLYLPQSDRDLFRKVIFFFNKGENLHMSSDMGKDI